jgi:hypothetical protein
VYRERQFLGYVGIHEYRGKTTERGTVGENKHGQKEIPVDCEAQFRKNHATTATHVTGQQKWLFMLKSLVFTKTVGHELHNPTSTVGLQSLNL